MTFGDTPFIALGFAALLWASQTHATGIAPLDMSAYVEAPATCQTEAEFNAMVIGPRVGLYPLYLQLNAALCAKPALSYEVVNYVPNDPDFHFAVPRPMPPQPVAPVPLPAGGGMLLAALFALILAGYRRGWCDATDTAPADERVM